MLLQWPTHWSAILTKKSQRKILITAALPYANGPIHIGHLVEHFYVDIWRRFQIMQGHQCIAICADDTHGTPIMLSARQNDITPEELIKKTHAEHVQDFKEFNVLYDYYGSTHSEANKEVAYEVFAKLQKNNRIIKKHTDQLYCNDCQMFLPDRFVVGTCPKCKSLAQNGDQCDKCAATYETRELIEPKCKTCSSAPTLKGTEHLFFELSKDSEFLRSWIKDNMLPAVANKLLEWIREGLQDWCITRDAPYFGFEVPGYKGKYFYVWLDAPVGYISTTKEWAKNTPDFENFWKKSDTELYHFIGKDITYFHALFWPALLKNSGYRLPNGIFVHGFLTFNNEKMSKSKGTFIPANICSKHIDPLYLRYYLASKMNAGIDDFDLSPDDFISRVNSELIGKITNIASRGAQMLHKSFDGTIGAVPKDFQVLINLAKEKSHDIAKYYEERDFARVTAEIRTIAEETNRFFDSHKPWKMVKTDPEKCKEVLSTIMHVFRTLTIYLQPIMPSYAEKVAKLLGEETPYTWQDLETDISHTKLNSFKHLASRIEKKQLDAMINETKEVHKITDSIKKTAQTKGKVKMNKNASENKLEETNTDDKQSNYITFDDFTKIDLRVGRIVSAEGIPEANKLISLKVDIGTDVKHVFAGIKLAYEPEQLVGKLVAFVANLKPRKMKFGISEGMLLAAGDGGENLFLLSPDSGAKPGDEIG